MNPTRILPDLQCSLLCEEVRQEVTGNFFLVGVINFIRVPQVPVVAFKVGGIPDIVLHEQSGLLVDPLSIPDLLAAVGRLVENGPLREQMGRNGRARVEDNFTLAHQGQLWNGCLMRLRNADASDGFSFTAMSGPVA